MNKKINLLVALLAVFICSLYAGCEMPDFPMPGDPEKIAVAVYAYTENPQTGEFEKSWVESKSVEANTAYTYVPKDKANYDIDAQKSVLKIASVGKDSVISVYYKCQTCVVTFSGGEGATIESGKDVQVIKKGQTPEIPSFKKPGYSIKGLDKELGPVYEDTQFTIEWQIATYTLNLVLPSSAVINDENYQKSENGGLYVRKFTMDHEFVLPEPYYNDNLFKGWFDSADGNGSTYEKIAKGTLNDITLYGVFDKAMYEIQFVAPENYSFSSIFEAEGTTICPPYIAPEIQKPGYGLNWYDDKDCTVLYEFDVMPKGGDIVYGKWELDTGTGFLEIDYNTEEIDNFQEFLVYADFASFNYWEEGQEQGVKLGSGYTFDNIRTDMQGSHKYMEYNLSTRFNATYNGIELKIYTPSFMKEKEAKNSTASRNIPSYGYVGYEEKGRENYNNFYIDSLVNSYEVETTNQLLYVVEHGYRPVCIKGSSAENIYNKAKIVLNSIIEKGDSDYEKAVKIFDYLALNIEYDFNAAEHSYDESNDDLWAYCDAFFLEGVFNNKKAVCDGIAKAYSLMCNMEGIPCVKVDGNGHAWCKTKINNKWTIVDPTHGNTYITNANKGIISHEHFGMSEATKAKLGYSSEKYGKISATGSINYFKNKHFNYNGESFNFVVGNRTDLERVLRYSATTGALKGKTIDVLYLKNSFLGNFDTALEGAVSALRLSGIQLPAISTISDKYENGGTVEKIIFSE